MPQNNQLKYKLEVKTSILIFEAQRMHAFRKYNEENEEKSIL